MFIVVGVDDDPAGEMEEDLFIFLKGCNVTGEEEVGG